MKNITSKTRISVTIREEDGSVTNRNEKVTASAGFLNTMCCALGEAAQRMEQLGCPALAKEYRAIRDSIGNVLEYRGLYADIE